VIEAKEILDQESAKRFLQQIVYYPLVLGVNLILTVISSAIGFGSECMPLSCAILNGCWCLQGLIDAILYGNNSIVRNEMKAHWKKRKSSQTISQTSESLSEATGNTTVIYSHDY